ncbi:CDP-glycerol glycerophosphotransferase family protein [Cellulomonas aerilata]|uniref:Glycosyl transferase n=1 Tax=Cellulomonas aerilata TaxID=515326 RepID=A0A512DF42_9CELL|nr:CDP-glycerol glycerophosphotransferase family protein [Cellulomonas aerilata]GEO35056.1 hypothetical protein CAE01nite_27810 [Cellulomonas aerilata]
MLSDLRRRLLGRLRWYWLREEAVAGATWLAMRVLPAKPVALVHGFPDSEGNAVEVVRGLVRRYPGTVLWLHNGPEPSEEMRHLDVPAGKVAFAQVNTLPAIRAVGQAEAVFFTHGMKTAVRPPRSRLVVNLWHGDGPKATITLPRCASTVAVAATHLWAAEKARIFGLRTTDVAVVGNPRVDSARLREVSETRRLLGLGDGGERIVLWMPTFRQGHDGRHFSFTDGEPLSSTVDAAITVPAGVRLLVKPHPMDTDDYSALGATVLTNGDLAKAGVTLAQLLAAADALMSDASSVWVDFLGFDRPVGFFLPDFDRYADTRGYNVPDLLEVLPGPVLPDLAAVSAFLAEVRDGRAAPPRTFDAFARIGYHAEPPVTDHLLTWLDDYQRARGARTLFAGSAAVPGAAR